MQKLNSSFNFEIKDKGNYIDIAELYVAFFKTLNMENRVEEVNLISKNNLFSNFPFLCMLFKWLIEISRKLFQESVKVNYAELETADDHQKT
jgi:hypothetical protein